jgi:hypothetical protein
VVVPTSGLVVVEPLEVVVAVVTVVAEVVAVEEVIAVAAGCVPEVETGALGGIVPSSVEAPCWVDVERCPPPLSWPAGAGGGADSRAGSANHAAATPAAQEWPMRRMLSACACMTASCLA